MISFNPTSMDFGKNIRQFMLYCIQLLVVMNEKLFSSLIMVDLRKAFDTVCHKKVTKETIFKWSKIFFTIDKYRGASAIHFKATVKSYLRQ